MTAQPVRPATRIILFVAALALVALYFVPLWRITLDAPQFPEGLGLLIEIDTIVGENPHDLQNINGLNHYIGMKEIHPESIPELRWMPWILGLLIGWGLAAALTGRRWMVCGWFGLLALAAVAGLVDFYAWGYDYGHNLDAERAIIKIPGMTYQPPLIGSKQLLNFEATSLPALGGWIAILVGLTAAWRCWVERRGALRGVVIAVALVGVSAAGCGDLGIPNRVADHAATDHARPVHADHAAAPDPAVPDEPSSPVAPSSADAAGAAVAGAGVATIVVDPSGDGVRSIADAVRRAAPGARILVRPGVYREPTIVVDRPVTIEGEGHPVIDGEGRRELFVIEADDVRLTGLVLRDVGVSYVDDRAAVRVEGAANCEIDHNRIHGGFFAIYLARAIGCRVTDNEIVGTGSTETDSGNGVHAWHAREIVVESNRISGHRDGIYFEFVEDGRVSRNEVVDNIRYGLHFMFSDGGRYEQNRFVGNGAGVAVMYTRDIEMLGNRFEDSHGSASFGILLKDITDSQIRDNVVSGNSVGLYAEGFDRTSVRGNRFEANGRALRLLSNSTGSSFMANDFIGNSFDVTSNGRHVRSDFSGNYWDEYAGYDLDADGTGDVPHRPMRFFALVVERAPATTVLLRGAFVSFLDWTESLIPSLTPANLVDTAPSMTPVADEAGSAERSDPADRAEAAG